MNYNWSTIITPDESVQKEFTISQKYLKFVMIAVIILSVLLMFVQVYTGILILFLGGIYCLYLYKAKHYAFTNRRVILVDSFLGKTIISIDYSQITDTEMEQNVFEQMLKWGTIIINTAGTNSPQFNIGFIENPESVRQELDVIRVKNKPQAVIATAQT